MSANDFISKTTPSPPAPPPSIPPSAVDPWIGVIIFALVFGLSLLAAAYANKYVTEKNEKHVQELRNQLREVLERERKAEYPDPPYTLKIDVDKMPKTKLPDPTSLMGSPGKFSNSNLAGKGDSSAARKRSKKSGGVGDMYNEFSQQQQQRGGFRGGRGGDFMRGGTGRGMGMAGGDFRGGRGGMGMGMGGGDFRGGRGGGGDFRGGRGGNGYNNNFNNQQQHVNSGGHSAFQDDAQSVNRRAMNSRGGIRVGGFIPPENGSAIIPLDEQQQPIRGDLVVAAGKAIKGTHIVLSQDGRWANRVEICQFYMRQGSCRHQDKCSKVHVTPTISPTVMLPMCYPNPKFIPADTNGKIINYDEKWLMKHFNNFYEKIWMSMMHFGRIRELQVCDNMCPHLLGHVYIMYEDEASAANCVQQLSGKKFDTILLLPELVPVTNFNEAACGDYDNGICARGEACNFLHVLRPPRTLVQDLIEAQDAFWDIKSREADEFVQKQEEEQLLNLMAAPLVGTAEDNAMGLDVLLSGIGNKNNSKNNNSKDVAGNANSRDDRHHRHHHQHRSDRDHQQRHHDRSEGDRDRDRDRQHRTRESEKDDRSHRHHGSSRREGETETEDERRRRHEGQRRTREIDNGGNNNSGSSRKDDTRTHDHRRSGRDRGANDDSREDRHQRSSNQHHEAHRRHRSSDARPAEQDNNALKKIEQFKDLFCHICGGSGHISRDCKLKILE